MSWIFGARNAISIGLGGLVTLFSGTRDSGSSFSNLLTELGENLVQENGGLILLEPGGYGDPGRIGSTFIIGVSAVA